MLLRTRSTAPARARERNLAPRKGRARRVAQRAAKGACARRKVQEAAPRPLRLPCGLLHLKALVLFALCCLWAFGSYFIMEDAGPGASLPDRTGYRKFIERRPEVVHSSYWTGKPDPSSQNQERRCMDAWLVQLRNHYGCVENPQSFTLCLCSTPKLMRT